MGTHISKVRSADLDQLTDDEFTWIEHQGNQKSNALYESAIPQRMRRPCVDSPDCIRRRWLREKYDNQMFSAGQEHRGLHQHESTSGWLLKRGSLMKTWKRCKPASPLKHARPPTSQPTAPSRRACRRFFVVQDGTSLSYYSDDSCTDKVLRGSFSLRAASLQCDPDDPLTLRLIGIEDRNGDLVAKAETAEQADEWAWSLFQCTYGASLPAPPDACEPNSPTPTNTCEASSPAATEESAAAALVATDSDELAT